MLVERDTELARLSQVARLAVTERRGRLVFVGGEAGIGKSALVRAVTDELGHQMPDAVVLRGQADNVTAAAPLGVVVDALPSAASLVDDAVSRMVLFTRIRELVTQRPSILVLEDVQWADDVSLDLLRYLGRRLDDVPLLILATYRSEETGPHHPLSHVLGDLASSPTVERMSLQPLSRSGVESLCRTSGSTIDAAALAESTGGVPFFVMEVLAAGEGEQLPATVRDAVLARASRLSADARSVLSAAAVVGRPADASLLLRAAGTAPAALAECLDAGVLVTAGEQLDFRHDLARLSVYESLRPDERAPLHQSVLRLLLDEAPDDHRSIAHHAAHCASYDVLLEHALLAAETARRVGAHREAASEYRLALLGARSDPARRAEIYAALSYECYLTDQVLESLTARQQALDLARVAGDRLAIGTSQRWVSRLSWFLGRERDAEDYADRAIATLEPLGETEELAMAWSNRAQVHMLAGRSESAIEAAGRALQLARGPGWREVEIHALNNIGSAQPALADLSGVPSPLRRSLEMALEDDAQEHAARAFTNLGCIEVRAARFASAESVLRQGIDYCRQRDLDSWVRYMTSWLAVALAEQGRYDDAFDQSTSLLAHPLLSPVSRVQAEIVVGTVLRRRGIDDDAAREHLAAAVRVAGDTGQFQRIGPAAAAMAETLWLDGRTDQIPAVVGTARELDPGLDSLLTEGELCWWLWVAGDDHVEPRGAVLEPFERALAGDLDAAGALWLRAGAPLRAALAWGLAPSLDSARRALALIDDLGVPAVRDAILRERQARHLRVPRGPRAATRGNDALLTSRELEVLRCVAASMTNAEVARQLYLSEKTVDHHVSAILRKLGTSTRRAAVVAARSRGILPVPTGD